MQATLLSTMKGTALVAGLAAAMLISACMPIHAMPATAPQEAQAAQILYTADVLRGGYDLPAVLESPASVEAAPILVTSDILRGLYAAPLFAPQASAAPEKDQFISTSDILRELYAEANH